MLQLMNDNECFVCGQENVNGLQIRWATENRRTEAVFYPTKSFQGWKGIVHGGILGTLMDEAITRLAWEYYGEVLTAEIKIRYYNPARIGEKLLIKGEIGELKNRIILGQAEIRNTSGHLIASATGKVFKPKESHA